MGASHFRGQLKRSAQLSVASSAATDHFLSNCPKWLADQLSFVVDDPDGGELVYGTASDFVAMPPYSATADAAAYQLIGTAATAVPQTTVGGVVQLASQAVDNAVAVLRLNAECFRYSTTKDLWFAARIAPNDADDSEIIAGLAIGTYAATDLATLPTDGIFFHKAETATVLSFHTRNGGTSTTTASTVTLTDGGYIDVAFCVRDGGVEAFVDGARIASHTTNLPAAATVLAVFLGVQAGSAGGDSMDVDHLLIAQER